VVVELFGSVVAEGCVVVVTGCVVVVDGVVVDGVVVVDGPF
jgi:hypothetical protein